MSLAGAICVYVYHGQVRKMLSRTGREANGRAKYGMCHSVLRIPGEDSEFALQLTETYEFSPPPKTSIYLWTSLQGTSSSLSADACMRCPVLHISSEVSALPGFLHMGTSLDSAFSTWQPVLHLVGPDNRKDGLQWDIESYMGQNGVGYPWVETGWTHAWRRESGVYLGIFFYSKADM